MPSTLRRPHWQPILTVSLAVALSVIVLLATHAAAQFSSPVDGAPCGAGALNSHITSFATNAEGTGSGSDKTFSVNASSLTIEYCANGPGLAAVQLWEKAPGAGSYTLVATDSGPVPAESASGSFSDIAVSADGQYEFYTRAVSSAVPPAVEAAPGTPDLILVRDNQAPAPTFETPATPTKDSTPAFQGTAGNAAGDSGTVAVRVYAGSSVSGEPVRTLSISRTATTWAGQDADWSSALPDGIYTAQAWQGDAAGNGGASAARTFTVDTTSPVVGFDATAPYTSDTTPAFTGTAGAATGDSTTITVKIYAGSAATGTPVDTFAVTRSGATWMLTDLGWLGHTALVAGNTYTAQAEQADTAGNPAGLSAARTFTVDIAAPQPTVDAYASPSNDSTPNLGGGAGNAAGDSATVSVEFYSGNVAVGDPVATINATRSAATWSLSNADWGTTTLTDGATYTAQAMQSDAAGNSGTSATRTFVVDVTPPAVTMNAPPTVTQDSTPALGGSAGNATRDGSDVTVRIYSGQSPTGSAVQTFTVARSGLLSDAWTVNNATWSTSSLPDGTYTAQASQSDTAGNTGTSTARTFTVDTAGPAAPSIDSAPTDPTNQTNASFAFTPAESGGVMTCQLDAGTVATCASRTAQSYSSLDEGAHDFTVTQVDAAGNTGASSVHHWVVDTTSPGVTLTALPGETGDSTPGMSGTAGNAAGDSSTVTVAVYSGSTATGTPVRTISVTRSGASWAITDGDWALALPDGLYTARATQTDTAGNTGASSASTFRVLTGVRTIASAPSYRTGITPFQVTYEITDAQGNSLTPAQAHVTRVELWVALPGSNQFTLADTDFNPTLNQSIGFTYSPESGDGSYRFYTVGYNVADPVETKAGADATTIVDTQGPAPTLSQPANPTSDATPNLAGAAGDATGDSQTLTVSVYQGPVAAGEPVRTLTATRAGAIWSSSNADWSSPLADGLYTAQATQADAAGNSGTSTARSFTIDATSPAVSMNAPASRATDTTPNLAGAAGNATGDAQTVTVDLYAGQSATGDPIASVSVDRTGPTGAAWTLGNDDWDTPLGDGTYTAQAQQGDTAGNTGHSVARTFTIDTAAPALTLTQPPTPTNDATPNLGGVAGDSSGDSQTVTLDLWTGATASGDPARSITVNRTGDNWSLSDGDWSTPLTDGVYTARAHQDDDLAHSTSTPFVTFTVDTNAPAAPALAQKPEAATSSRSASFAFTPAESGGSSHCRLDAGTFAPCDARTSHAYSDLNDGPHTFSVRQRDDAGNDGAAASYSWTVDRTAPTVTLDQPADGTDTTPALTGDAGSADGDAPAVTLRVYAGNEATGPSVQTISVPRAASRWAITDAQWQAALAPGTYTAQASQADTAGNVGSSQARTFTVAATPVPPITVAPTPMPPTLQPKSPLAAFAVPAGQRLAVVLRRGLAVTLAVNEPVTGQLRLVLTRATATRLGLRSAVVARTTVRLGKAGVYRVRIPFSSRAKTKLRRLRSVRLSLRGSVRGLNTARTSGLNRALRLRR